MGCNSSKAATSGDPTTPVAKGKSTKATAPPTLKKSHSREDDVIKSRIRSDKPERLYKLLAKALEVTVSERQIYFEKVLEHCQAEPMAAKWQDPSSKRTPLHAACQLLGTGTSEGLAQVIETLLAIHAGALREMDDSQNIPLHYAIAPTKAGNETNWELRAIIVQALIQGDSPSSAQYLQGNDRLYDSGDATGGCTPLYRALQTLPDDFDGASPTVDYIAVLQAAYPHNAGRGNLSDGDKPLSLLYRRFTRQFDISEQFFTGDNSRPEVVKHRQRYKSAAGATWKLIELLLRPPETAPTAPWGIVHRAVQVETPPDLLRYIVETNAQDLTRVDPAGNLPLHYAAASKPAPAGSEHADRFPTFYTKYVVDELLYKFPEAAAMTDAEGRYPLTLAIESGKPWIGGGIKSLYDAHPNALQQVSLEGHPGLMRALSMVEGEGTEDKQDSKEDSNASIQRGIIQDEHHDAIMLVQKPDAQIDEIVTSMWAHEEDAGVQMLGCVAIANLLQNKAPVQVLQIAISATASVVNAMKAHPNEVIVQEKACQALQCLAVADGEREVSMIASGAVAAIVGAMQAHVGDASVQEQACRAIASIVGHGGQADRATVVASVSGVTAILNALAAHSQVLGVQLAGLDALDGMTQHDQANLPDLPKTQTEPLLLAAKEQFPEECSERVQALLQRMST